MKSYCTKISTKVKPACQNISVTLVENIQLAETNLITLFRRSELIQQKHDPIKQLLHSDALTYLAAGRAN